MTNLKLLILATIWAIVLYPIITRWQEKRRKFYDELWGGDEK